MTNNVEIAQSGMRERQRKEKRNKILTALATINIAVRMAIAISATTPESVSGCDGVDFSVFD